MTKQTERMCKEYEANNAVCGCKQEHVCCLSWNAVEDKPMQDAINRPKGVVPTSAEEFYND